MACSSLLTPPTPNPPVHPSRGRTLGTAVRRVASERQLQLALTVANWPHWPAAALVSSLLLRWQQLHHGYGTFPPGGSPRTRVHRQTPRNSKRRGGGGGRRASSCCSTCGKGGAKDLTGRPMVCLPCQVRPAALPSRPPPEPCRVHACVAHDVDMGHHLAAPSPATCSSGAPQPRLHPAGTHGAQPPQGPASWLHPAHQLLCAGQEGPGHGACLSCVTQNTPLRQLWRALL
jgi:hypothetical protein